MFTFLYILSFILQSNTYYCRERFFCPELKDRMENKAPRLQRWGPAATARMLTADSDLCEPQKKALLDILGLFKNPQAYSVPSYS